MQNNLCFRIFLLLVTCYLPAPYAVANPPGDGGIEIWVDGPAEVQPGGNRDAPDAAVDPQGRSIFVWYTNIVRSDIFMRRFDKRGNALEDPIAVNTLVEDDQLYPRLAVSQDGSFLVVWESDELDPDVGFAQVWIRGQAFDADANPVGAERLISAVSTGAGTIRYTDVAALTGGGYVVVWNQESAIAPATGRHIQARLVSADGAPNGDAFVANSRIGTGEYFTAVTELDDGGFFAVWRAARELWGRRFSSTGAGVGEDFRVDGLAPARSIVNPDVVRGADGHVLVIWEDPEEPGDGNEIRGRMYSPALNPLGDDFRINVLTELSQRQVRAGSYGKYGFLVAWESEVSAGDDNDSTSIQGRLVTGANAFGGPQFTLNQYTTAGQTNPGVGGMGDSIAIAWRSFGNDLEVNDDVITGQGWSECGIFCDGFEATKSQ